MSHPSEERHYLKLKAPKSESYHANEDQELPFSKEKKHVKIKLEQNQSKPSITINYFVEKSSYIKTSDTEIIHGVENELLNSKKVMNLLDNKPPKLVSFKIVKGISSDAPYKSENDFYKLIFQ